MYRCAAGLDWCNVLHSHAQSVVLTIEYDYTVDVPCAGARQDLTGVMCSILMRRNLLYLLHIYRNLYHGPRHDFVNKCARYVPHIVY